MGGQAAIVKALGSASNITIIAPSNDAFTAFLASDAGSKAAKVPSEVASLLTYHVLNGKYPSSAFTKTPLFIPTLLTDAAHTNVTGGQRLEARVNGANVEIITGLGQKSVVKVAVCPSAFLWLQTWSSLSPSGQRTFFANRNFSQDIKFDGGVIHVIDTVLQIPSLDSSTVVAAGLTSLANALTRTSLVSVVDSLHDVTIFAPTNAAFQATNSTVATLTLDQLAGVLEYHVVGGVVGYSSLLSNTTLKTVQGKTVQITLEGGNVWVNSAKVVTADILVANGVVHVIDR